MLGIIHASLSTLCSSQGEMEMSWTEHGIDREMGEDVRSFDLVSYVFLGMFVTGLDDLMACSMWAIIG